MKGQILRVYEALERGPGTAHEIAPEIGLPLYHVHAWLSELSRMGFIRRLGRLPKEEGKRKGPGPVLWEIVK